MLSQELGQAETLTYIEDLSKWSQRILEMEHSEEEIDHLLELLGDNFQGDRCYIFEIHSNATFSNTYEWCKEGITPQKDTLQNESLSQIEPWLKEFENKQPIIISDIEEIKYEHSGIYAVLKPQNIYSLVSFPILSSNEILGFIGLDNIDISRLNIILPILQLAANLLSYIIKMKRLSKKLCYLNHHDYLTRSFNRNALADDLQSSKHWESLGVIYCDISEIQKFNDLMGVEEGDKLIVSWNNLLVEHFKEYNVYRIGGSKFIILFPNIKKWQMSSLKFQMKDLIEKNETHLAFGMAWTDSVPIKTSKLISEAEHEMYLNKALYYNEIDPESGLSRNRRFTTMDGETVEILPKESVKSLLQNFIENNYFHLDTFFSSMSVADHHPYFGDLTTNLWYVSDSMKELWGFENNIVHDLLPKWKSFITNQEDLLLLEQDLGDILHKTKKVHDLVYRITDKNGEEFWIRCFGLVKMNEDNTKPLFFCGNVSKLNYAFIIDPTTNFQREQAAIREIGKIQQTKRKADFICFRLNGFSEINELKGRTIANNLIKDITGSITKNFTKNIQFFRLDGLRFLAIVPRDNHRSVEEVAKAIKAIAMKFYSEYQLPIRVPCSIGILNDYHSGMSSQEIMNDIMSMLEIAKNDKNDNIVYSSNAVQSHRAQKQMFMELNKNVSEDLKNFRVMIQPIVSVKTHKIVGGEMLLRWKYDNKDVSPAVFIPVLENNEMIIPVGRWVFEQAVRSCKRIHSYSDNFFLDFNVSYHQINDDELIPFMKETLEKWDFVGEHLVMELTETHYNDDPVRLQNFIDDCKHLGMRMALDDFGVGYSSLEMLLKYPANVVKLDRSLMQKMSDSKESSDFITTIVYACHKFGKLVCVEGVETEKELAIVTEAGCDLIQGYYFYKPMELKHFYSMLANQMCEYEQ